MWKAHKRRQHMKSGLTLTFFFSKQTKPEELLQVLWYFSWLQRRWLCVFQEETWFRSVKSVLCNCLYNVLQCEAERPLLNISYFINEGIIFHIYSISVALCCKRLNSLICSDIVLWVLVFISLEFPGLSVSLSGTVFGARSYQVYHIIAALFYVNWGSGLKSGCCWFRKVNQKYLGFIHVVHHHLCIICNFWFVLRLHI